MRCQTLIRIDPQLVVSRKHTLLAQVAVEPFLLKFFKSSLVYPERKVADRGLNLMPGLYGHFSLQADVAVGDRIAAFVFINPRGKQLEQLQFVGLQEGSQDTGERGRIRSHQFWIGADVLDQHTRGQWMAFGIEN